MYLLNLIDFIAIIKLTLEFKYDSFIILPKICSYCRCTNRNSQKGNLYSKEDLITVVPKDL